MRPLPLHTDSLLACAPARLPDRVAKPGPRMVTDVAMRDGTLLRTKLLLPAGQGPFPTVFLRVPYPLDPLLDKRCTEFNRHGYACLYQHARGRGPSQGDWLPFEHEPTDGRDALSWIAEQPWCDGNIAMMGESYLGATAWTVAEDPPPELKTIMPTVVGTNLREVIYEGGMFRHDIATAWMSLMPGPEFRYAGGSRHYWRALRHRPRRSMDEVAADRQIPWFRVWLDADPQADFWQREDVLRLQQVPQNTSLPVLTMAGWSDAFLGSQIKTFQQLATRERSTLVIGPWDHLTQVRADVKQRGLDDELGLAANYFQWPRVLDWLGHHLRGEPLRYPVGGVVSYVVNGGGWRWYEAWPPPTHVHELRFGPGEDPQECTGALGPQAGSGAVSWTYDPQDPTPSLGGAGVLVGSFPMWRGAEPGFVDQGRLCQRREDLVGFVSQPLQEPLHVAGGFRAQLRVATDAEDTAFNLRVLEQRPGGARIHVREGIVALSQRDGDRIQDYQPGSEVTLSIETWPVDYVFEAGSRVLVQLGSASFPKYEAHANTAEPWADAVRTVVATQQLLLEGSSVSMPVVVE